MMGKKKINTVTNSTGNYFASGGKTDITMSLGFGSFNFTTGKFSTFSTKNSWYENLGYGLGALANVSDILAGFNPGEVQLQTKYGIDNTGHSQLLDMDGNSLIDFGPRRRGDFYKFNTGRNNWVEYNSAGKITQTKDIPGNLLTEGLTIKGVNVERLNAISSRLNNNPGYFNFLTRSCSSVISRSLFMSGAPMIGLHPYLLHAQAYLWNLGIRPWGYNYFLNK